MNRGLRARLRKALLRVQKTDLKTFLTRGIHINRFCARQWHNLWAGRITTGLNPVGLEFQNIIIRGDYLNTALKFRIWQYKSARKDKITMSSGNRGILQVFRRAAKKAKNFRLFTKRWVRFPEMYVLMNIK